MSGKNKRPLDAKLLRISCDMGEFDFKTTDDLAEQIDFFGQDRAIEAVHLGLGIERDGFNIFALGPPGIGKRTIVRSLLQRESAGGPRPMDICYVHNFDAPRNPRLLFLEPGVGITLARDMRQLIDVLRISIPEIFESKAYEARIREIQEEMQKKQEAEFGHLEEQAKDNGVTILRTPQGFMLASMKAGGDIISEDEFKKLPKEEQEEREEGMRQMRKHLTEYLEKIPRWQKDLSQRIKDAVQYFIMIQVGSAISDLVKRYSDQPDVVDFLKQVQQAILDRPTDFRKKREDLSDALTAASSDETRFNRYQVNVMVDNSEAKGAPIVFEDNPTFTNLVGRVDHISHFGILTTDFMQIRSGSLMRANGGYLLIDARKLLTQAFSWDALKRTLKAKEIRIENLYQLLGYAGSVSLEPCPIPLEIKVVLFGDRRLYYLLSAFDPEFLELFKVAADFDEDVKRDRDAHIRFFHLIKSLLTRHGLKPLTREAVGEVTDFAARLAADNKKLSTHVTRLTDLLREADHYRAQSNDAYTDEEHVREAIEAQMRRAARLRERMREGIDRGFILIDTSGLALGQANALSYVSVGGVSFGHPVRITASVGAGKGRLIDIEREVKLGGPIHSKGVLILSGYLVGKFAKKHPLSLSASIVFEQSYGGIEGDSASVAEACALISAIAGVPIRQSIAITGSMNQHGAVQAIGGVNEKIEGFFDICLSREMSGEQGVIIPKANIEHLMLRREVVSAVGAGKFSIYAVETVDEAMEILTEQKAGQMDQGGEYPSDSVNGMVARALASMAEKMRAAFRVPKRG